LGGGDEGDEGSDEGSSDEGSSDEGSVNSIDNCEAKGKKGHVYSFYMLRNGIGEL